MNCEFLQHCLRNFFYCFLNSGLISNPAHLLLEKQNENKIKNMKKTTRNGKNDDDSGSLKQYKTKQTKLKDMLQKKLRENFLERMYTV